MIGRERIHGDDLLNFPSTSVLICLAFLANAMFMVVTHELDTNLYAKTKVL